MFAASKYALLFWLLAIAHLIGNYTNLELLQFFTKPLLMPVLIAWLYAGYSNTKTKGILSAGLFFSFLGDVFYYLNFSTRCFL
jgi:hypothetical protein